MKIALRNEKSKYKFRITLLKHWGVEFLKKLRSQANQIYNKLEDWILLSIRSENQALSKVTDILRNSIEREEKIKYELSLDVFDVIINKDVQNYIELPPELSPAKEVMTHERFNIDQLTIFNHELEAYVVKPHWIKTSILLDLLIKKFVNHINLDYINFRKRRLLWNTHTTTTIDNPQLLQIHKGIRSKEHQVININPAK